MRYPWGNLLGPWVALPAAALLGFNVFSRGMDWRGDALLAGDAQGIPLFIIGPLVCAAVAVDTARVGLAGNQQHVALTRPVMRPYLYALLWGVGVTSAVIVVFWACAVAFASWSYFDGQALFGSAGQLSVFVLSLLYLGAVGSLIGRVSSPVLAGLAGVVVGFAIGFSEASRGESFGLMATGGATVSRVGLQYTPTYRLWQVVLFAVLVLVAYVPWPRFSSKGTQVSVPVAAAAVIAIGTPFLLVSAKPAWLPGVRWEARADEVPLNCQGERPALCLAPQHEYARHAYQARVDQIVQGATAAGVAPILPDKIVEITRNGGSQVDGTTTWGFTLEEERHDGKHGIEYFLSDLISAYSRCSWEWTGPTGRQDKLRDALKATILEPTGYPSYVPKNFTPLTLPQAQAALKKVQKCT